MSYGVNQERQLLQAGLRNSSPADKYLPSRIDDSSNPKYYGFLAKGGAWYIMKENLDTGVTSYTYFTGTKDEQTFDDFSDSWDDRSTLTYVEACSLSLY